MKKSKGDTGAEAISNAGISLAANSIAAPPCCSGKLSPCCDMACIDRVAKRECEAAVAEDNHDQLDPCG